MYTESYKQAASEAVPHEAWSQALPKKMLIILLQEGIRVCNHITKKQSGDIIGLGGGLLSSDDLKRHSEGVGLLGEGLRALNSLPGELDLEFGVVCPCEVTLQHYRTIGVHTLSDFRRMDAQLHRRTFEQLEASGVSRQYHLIALATGCVTD